MAQRLMKYSDIFNYTTIWMDYLRGGETQLVNTNKLLRSYNGVTGLKTGTTSKAGVCICATATRGNMTLIAVVLGSDSSQERFSAAKKLLDFGFTNFETRQFPDISGIPEYLPVKLGVEKQVKLECTVPQKLLFVKGATSRLTVEIDLPQHITAPAFTGMKAGTVTLYGSQGKIKEYPVVLSKDALRMNFSTAFTILSNKVATM